MLKELQIEDMMYLNEIISEVYGLHAMIYNPKDKYCYLANPVSFEDGEILAIGIKEDSLLSIKIKTPDGEVSFVDAIDI